MTERDASGRENGAGAGSVVVRIPGPLRELAGGASEVEGTGETVGAVLDDLLGRHPGLHRHFRAENGSLRDHVNVYVNGEDVRWLAGEGTRVGPGDAVTVVPSIAGG